MKKIKLNNIEFFKVVTYANNSDKIIKYLLGLNEQNAKTISEIYAVLNSGKSQIYRHSILRTINSLIKYEPDKIKSKLLNGKHYYWMTISKIIAEDKKINEIKNKRKSNFVNNKTEKLLEKDLYPEVQGWLNNCTLDGIQFKYVISGGAIIDRAKYSNPDIIGTNIQGNSHLIVSVEVKNQLNNESELAGFAQCCSYKLFSDYVFLFCFKPTDEKRVSRLINMCQFYGIGLKFLNDDKLILEPQKNVSQIGDPAQKLKILEIIKAFK